MLHVAFGVDAERLDAPMRAHDVGINLHNEPYPSFENRVSLHLAAGHLVLSEPLDPTHGLEPGIDYLEVSTPEHLHATIALLQRSPNAHHRVRVRGRMKAEGFRASRVYPRLVHDLLLDLRAFGTEREVAPQLSVRHRRTGRRTGRRACATTCPTHRRSRASRYASRSSGSAPTSRRAR